MVSHFEEISTFQQTSVYTYIDYHFYSTQYPKTDLGMPSVFSLHHIHEPRINVHSLHVFFLYFNILYSNAVRVLGYC